MRTNPRALLVFGGVIALVVVGLIAYDIGLYARGGWEHTISWAMTVGARDRPILAFLWGLFVGGGGIGLAVHFWAGMPDPDLIDERERLLRDNDRLRVRLAELEGYHGGERVV
jgi:hypothetical protein